MTIDVHTHIWNDQVDRLPEFIAGLDESGVDIACVLPIAPYMSNEDVARLRDRAAGRIIGWASVVPFAQTTGIARVDPVDQLVHAVESLGLRGLKLHPMIQGFALNDPGLIPVVRAAGELGVPVLFHTGPSNGRVGRIENARIELLDDLAIMCPDTVLIAGHANPIVPATTYLARKHPNVYLEPSMSWPRYAKLTPGLTAMAVEHAGANKVVFGSDYSIGKANRVDAVREALSELSPTDLDAVLHHNAARVLGLED